MDLRQKMNENPVLAAGIGGGIVLLAIIILIFSMRGPSHSDLPKLATDKGFFSDDDGKTWYIDDLKNIPPYQHSGKTAYRAEIFMASNDEPFVGYLESYEAADKPKIEAAIQGGKPADAALGEFVPSVKKPGAKSWVKTRNGDRTAEWTKTVIPLAPDKQQLGVRGPLRVTDKDIAAEKNK